MNQRDNQISVQVWRGKEKGRFQTYSVPSGRKQTVLDVVTWIRQNLDSTLSYRFACRVGMCGSCAMTVNGEPRWSCRTLVKRSAVIDGLKIAPLANLPIIKDLAVDLSPFFEKWIAAEGFHHPNGSRTKKSRQVEPDSAFSNEAEQFIECINCAICYAACDTVRGNPQFLGPAALQRAWTVYCDPRISDKEGVLKAVSGNSGCHNCHSQGGCTAFCPVDLNPMKAIAGLKKATVRQALWRVEKKC